VALVLRGVRVLDERGGFTDPLDVTTSDGTITAVGRNLPSEPGHRQLDAHGLWLLPGIVDCHAHIGLPSFDALELLHMPLSLRTLETAHALRRTLQAGVTFMRDAGGIDAGVRDAVTRGYIPGPHLQVSVLALGPTGGHGDGFLAGPALECATDYTVPDYPGRPPLCVDGPDEMRKAVRRLLRSGADWIKLMATGGVMAAGDGMFEPELTDDEIAMAIAEASRRHKGVMVHALGGSAIRAAVNGGARSIEHAIFLTEADARLMADRGCALVPTLTIYHELADLAAADKLADAVSQRMARVAPRLGEAVRIARTAGVPIALGSDFGHRDQHGRNLVELHYLHLAGLTVEEALLAGTANGASLCGVSDSLGRIAPGYAFDALLLDEDPGDLSCFTRSDVVTGVFKGGTPVLPHPRLDA
jgi:imidazolonepropionase-like amidohydrolase